MSQIVEISEEINQTNIHYVQTKKFKTIHLVVKFRAPLQRETITKRALLPYVLRQGTKTYPTEMELQRKLDHMYGSSLSIDGGKKGNNHILSFRLEIANDKYIPNESSIIDDALDLVHEIIYEPKTVANSFDPRIFARESQTLRQIIQTVIDDKMRYANMRLFDEMCADERYSIHAQGYVEDLDELTVDELYAYYQKMLENDVKDVYVLGDFNKAEMQEKLTSLVSKPSTSTDSVFAEDTWERREEPHIVVEKQPIQQAKLHIGYRTNCTFQDDDYFALQLFNGMLGGFPSSKLFLNVREKHSLAYYAASRVESHKGLLLVMSGIDGKDYEQAKNIIDQQISAIKEGDFTEGEISETKEQLINQILETLDHPQGIIEMLYQQVPANRQLTPEELINQIKAATKQDIVDIAQKIELDTIYLLTSSGGETNE